MAGLPLIKRSLILMIMRRFVIHLKKQLLNLDLIVHKRFGVNNLRIVNQR
jgi:hypothetical protein